MMNWSDQYETLYLVSKQSSYNYLTRQQGNPGDSEKHVSQQQKRRGSLQGISTKLTGAPKHTCSTLRNSTSYLLLFRSATCGVERESFTHRQPMRNRRMYLSATSIRTIYMSTKSSWSKQMRSPNTTLH